MRDAFHLARPGADPGPAGRRLIAWRELSARSVGHWRSSFHAAAEVLGVPHDEALQEAVDAAEACAAGDRPAPFAAAQVFAFARRALTPSAGRRSPGGRGGEGELLAAWLADAVLAQRLKWPFALPLLAAPLFAGGGRRAGGESPTAPRAPSCSPRQGRRRGPAIFRPILAGGRKSCMTAAPKLRAKGAGAALAALLDEDSLSASDENLRAMSERGARRLFDRLVALGAVRELTGRATFRLYGL